MLHHFGLFLAVAVVDVANGDGHHGPPGGQQPQQDIQMRPPARAAPINPTPRRLLTLRPLALSAAAVAGVPKSPAAVAAAAPAVVLMNWRRET